MEGALLFGLIGIVLSGLVAAMWYGLHMMFGIGFSPEAAQGLPLVLGSAGVITGGVLAAMFD